MTSGKSPANLHVTRSEDDKSDIATCARNAFEGSPLAIAATEGPHHIVRYVSPAFCRICRTPDSAMLGLPYEEAVPTAHKDGCIALLDRVYQTGRSESLDRCVHISENYEKIYWSYSVWAIREPGKQPTGLMLKMSDVTARVQADRELEDTQTAIREVNQALILAVINQQEFADVAMEAQKELAASQLRIAEQDRLSAVTEERSMLAREIHDTLAQTFTSILMQVRLAQRISKTRPAEAWAIIESVSDVAQQGLTEARRSIWALQPETSDFSDLPGALATAVQRLSSGTSVQMLLATTGEPRPLPPFVGMNLLRIAQEAMSNALAHANAQIVSVELAMEADRVVLHIQDDGRGIDLMGKSERDGFGLIAMRQRAERLGGHLTISSRPGLGTEITAVAPLPTP